MKRLRSCERGQAITEFALVIPILLLLLMGVVELGRIFHAYLVVSETARDAARYLSVGADDQVSTSVQNDTQSLDQSQNKVTYTITPSDPTQRTSGSAVTIQIRYPVNLITPVLDDIFPNPTVVQASITMRKE